MLNGRVRGLTIFYLNEWNVNVEVLLFNTVSVNKLVMHEKLREH